uniref:Uncharacterized protein n=1 Tax=Rhodococcus erythropolis TaxID=1833 RepID=Q6XNB6_RHOER|nr:hypothetical protein PBD2.030 [Rhodococcus erythropolis]
MSVLSTAVMSRLGIAFDDGSWRWIALSFPVVGRFVRRVQLAATPLDSRDPTWSLLGHERWAPRVAASVVADAQRGFLLLMFLHNGSGQSSVFACRISKR